MAQIEFDQIGKRFGAALPPALHQVDLRIAPGEFCVFVGPSGCGKSSLLRLIAGLDEPSEGELRIGGQRMNGVAPAQRGVAMVFQSYALYPHMTVYDNMAFGLQVNGTPRADIDRQVRQAAAVLQLLPLLDRKPKALSGGQRQRVAIGRAIVKQPRVFLFDEPLSNLDASLRAQTRLEIARLHRELGSASMVYVTHDQVEAMTLATQIVLLHAGDRIASHGSVAQAGSPMDLYHRPASRFVAEFIGSPAINLLPGRLQAADAGQAQVTVADRTVAAAVDARHLAPGTEVSLGVRPEHLRLANGPTTGHGTGQGQGQGGTVLQALVQHVERLGECSLLYLALAEGAPMTLRIDGHATEQPGDAVAVLLAADAMHLFDAQGQACRRTLKLPV